MIKHIHLKHFILQSVYAFIFILLVLFALDKVAARGLLWAVGASSVSSSAFIVFTRPCPTNDEARCLIGSYLLSVLVGIACLHMFDFCHVILGIPHMHAVELSVAFSVGIITFLMTVLKFWHPPAASMTLVLSLQPWGYATVIVVLIAIFILAGLSIVMRPYLHDLITHGVDDAETDN